MTSFEPTGCPGGSDVSGPGTGAGSARAAKGGPQSVEHHGGLNEVEGIMKKLFLVVLLLTGCLTIDSVTQPSSVAVGESFSVTVEGTNDSTTYNGTAVWLGMMLPNYVEVESVRYKTSGGLDGVLTEPDSLMSSWLQQDRPPDSGMYATAFSFTPPAESSGTFKAQVYLYVGDSTSPGHYLIDYYIGYYYFSWTIDDSMLDQPMEVTGLGKADARAAKGVRAGRIWPSLFRDRLNIEVPEPEDIRILDADGRLVKSLHVEGTGSWDGRGEYGRRLPAGAFLIRGRQISSRVILVD
jgi:hypothetical protein